MGPAKLKPPKCESSWEVTAILAMLFYFGYTLLLLAWEVLLVLGNAYYQYVLVPMYKGAKTLVPLVYRGVLWVLEEIGRQVLLIVRRITQRWAKWRVS